MSPRFVLWSVLLLLSTQTSSAQELFVLLSADTPVRTEASVEAHVITSPFESWAHGPLIMRVIDEEQGFILVETVGLMPEERYCHGGQPPGLEGLRLRVFVPKDAPLTVVTRHLEMEYDDGTQLVVQPGQPVVDDTLRFGPYLIPLELDEQFLGTRFTPSNRLISYDSESNTGLVLNQDVSATLGGLELETSGSAILYVQNAQDVGTKTGVGVQEGCVSARLEARPVKPTHRAGDRLSSLWMGALDGMRSRRVIRDQTALYGQDGRAAGKSEGAFYLPRAAPIESTNAEHVCFEASPGWIACVAQSDVGEVSLLAAFGYAGAALRETVPAGRDKETIKANIDHKKSRFRKCYRNAKASKPGLTGQLSVQAIIEPSGKVGHVEVVESTLKHPTLERCVSKVISDLEFEPADISTTVTYPIHFK